MPFHWIRDLFMNDFPLGDFLCHIIKHHHLHKCWKVGWIGHTLAGGSEAKWNVLSFNNVYKSRSLWLRNPLYYKTWWRGCENVSRFLHCYISFWDLQTFERDSLFHISRWYGNLTIFQKKSNWQSRHHLQNLVGKNLYRKLDDSRAVLFCVNWKGKRTLLYELHVYDIKVRSIYFVKAACFAWLYFDYT